MKKMFSVKIEIFGVPSGVTSLKSVDVTLEDGATVSDLAAAIRQAIPALEGKVIRRGENRLVENYSFNINGNFYSGNESIKLNSNDSIKLVMLATGG